MIFDASCCWVVDERKLLLHFAKWKRWDISWAGSYIPHLDLGYYIGRLFCKLNAVWFFRSFDYKYLHLLMKISLFIILCFLYTLDLFPIFSVLNILLKFVFLVIFPILSIFSSSSTTRKVHKRFKFVFLFFVAIFLQLVCNLGTKFLKIKWQFFKNL